MTTVFPASRTTFTLPPNDQLHYVLVQVSPHRYAVAEWAGSAPLTVLPSVQKAGEKHLTMQAGCSFRLVSEPLTYSRACDRLVLLYQERFAARGLPMPDLFTTHLTQEK